MNSSGVRALRQVARPAGRLCVSAAGIPAGGGERARASKKSCRAPDDGGAREQGAAKRPQTTRRDRRPRPGRPLHGGTVTILKTTPIFYSSFTPSLHPSVSLNPSGTVIFVFRVVREWPLQPATSSHIEQSGIQLWPLLLSLSLLVHSCRGKWWREREEKEIEGGVLWLTPARYLIASISLAARACVGVHGLGTRSVSARVHTVCLAALGLPGTRQCVCHCYTEVFAFSFRHLNYG